ncbi:MAG: putative baseplate assembly protein [Cyanobacteria bacterium P01_H01_bin.21]
MNSFLARELLALNDCGCCDGIGLYTPVEVFNRAGLETIAYRTGQHGQFKQSMLAQLSSAELSALRSLTTRDDDDFAIALLDAWATVADILTFYQERIAQESYLHTATERLSIRHLARLIGYQLQPGVAASTQLAFTLDTAPGSPAQITLDAGTKVQSIPGKDELPQLFETSTAIEARIVWNSLRPRLTQPQTSSSVNQSVTVQGIANNLQKGDKLLIFKGSSRSFKTVFRVTPNQAANTTRLDLIPGAPPALPDFKDPTFPPGVEPTQKVPLTQAQIDSHIIGKSWPQEDLLALIETQGWSVDSLTETIIIQQTAPAQPAEVYVFRLSAPVFGHNAAKQIEYTNGDDPKPVIENGTLKQIEWQPAGEARSWLFLDNAYEGITQGGYVAIRKAPSSNPAIAKVNEVSTLTRSEYNLSGKTTRLILDTDWWKANSFHIIRRSLVYAQSEALLLANLPITEAVQGDTITLDSFYLGLQSGQTLILTGERADLPGVTHSEVLVLKKITLQSGYTQITLQKGLSYPYRRDTVTINANVAPATHGETVQEILGSGDASQGYQTFTLRQPPLTYVSSDATPSGTLSTLEIRVNDIRWHEAPMLYGQTPQDRSFSTRLTEAGNTLVKFGDGHTGERLPTGVNNIYARYRKGLGLAGNVKADQLTNLMSRPLGLKAVTNPLPASGGNNGESLANARDNAPLTVLTLDRVVSLQDFEDFSRAFGGIAKALATWTWMGQQRGVFVTVAGPNGEAIEAELIAKLLKQLQKSGDPHVPIQVQSYRAAKFTLAGKIQINPDFQTDSVLDAVKQAMRTAFSFEARAFGQGVALSEVLAVMQHVAGVVHVDLDLLRRYGFLLINGLKRPLPAAVPQHDGSNLLAAELLTLDPAALDQLGVLS